MTRHLVITARLVRLSSLASKVIPLREFAKDNGERFNPFANKVVKVWIGGGDYDYEAYGF